MSGARVTGLALVDETGRRYAFTYDTASARYISVSQCGLVGAVVDPHPVNFGARRTIATITDCRATTIATILR